MSFYFYFLLLFEVVPARRVPARMATRDFASPVMISLNSMINCLFTEYLAKIQLFKIWNLRVQKHLNIEKITFNVVQIKFLAMHITNTKLNVDIFTVGHFLNIFME